MAFPVVVKSIAEAMLGRPVLLRAIGGLQAALGVYLMIVSYL